MRPILLGFAALALFLGSVMMAPLTSEVAESLCQFGLAIETQCSPQTVLDIGSL